ncbi:ribonuclease H-like domain-containing protein [Tanacetum coccineum]
MYQVKMEFRDLEEELAPTSGETSGYILLLRLPIKLAAKRNSGRGAMLTVRVKKFIQRTGRNMDFKEKQPVSLDKSKIECYNCHRKGHFARECRSGRFEVEPVNYALMAISSSSSSSSFDSEVHKCSKCLESFKCLQKNYDTEREKHNKAKLEIRGYEIALESLESKIIGHEKNKLAWGEKYEF